MIKNEFLRKILLFVMPLFFVISYIFKIKYFLCFVVLFLVYGIMNRLNSKYTLYFIFINWYLMMFVCNDFTTLYSSLILGLLGNFIGYLFIKNNEIELPKINLNENIKKISFLFPIAVFFLLECLYLISNPGQYFDFSIDVIALNLIIIYSVWAIILALTGTTFRANTTLFVISVIYFFINQLKILYMGEAISYNDLIMVTQAGEIFDIIKTNFLDSLWYYRKLIIILGLNIYIFIKIFKKFDTGKMLPKIRLSLLCSILVIGFLLFPNEGKNNFIIKNFFNDNNITKLSPLTDYYGAYRMFGGLYDDYLSSIEYSNNDEFTESDLNKLYKGVKEESNKTFKKPNIIVMFTEAFWDITTQKSIQFSNDPLKEYHALKEKGIVIDTLSPTFGSRSANTEFEFITGASLSYFPIGPVGFQKYYQNDEAYNNPTIIKELKNNGYTTEILNSASGKLYNCQNVYNKWGVDNVRHLQDEFDYFVKDEYLVDTMIERFKNKKKDESLFYMTISMESHVPYQVKNIDHFDFTITTPMRESAKNLIRTYTQSIRNASLQLQRAYDYIKTLDEETIIIFYGDHLPFLKALNNDLYEDIAEFNTGDLLYDTYKKYNTETLILSNYDIDYDDIKIASPDIIFTTIINQMDIEISDYYKWLYSTRKTIPSINSLVAKDLNGKLYDTNNLPINMQKTFEMRKKVQNHLFK